MTRELCLAQLAAFLDGEGCITLLDRQRGTQYGVYHLYQPHVVIGNTDKRLMDWLMSTFNGWVSKLQPTGRPNAKVGYSWHMTNIKRLLHDVYPYLLLKKEQAEILMNFPMSEKPNRHRTDKDKRRQERACKRIRELNKRGVRA